MTAKGFIYYALHMGKDYYYLPTKETWSIDIKNISLGDIYFSNVIIKARMGYPDSPNMKDFPVLGIPEKKAISISIG